MKKSSSKKASKPFNIQKAKKFLLKQSQTQKKNQEQERKLVLKKAVSILQDAFHDSSVEVYLIGSILSPFRFSSRSDVDIVLKNFTGDRFELWAKLEARIERPVEIIPFETCQFQEFVLKNGLKVV